MRHYELFLDESGDFTEGFPDRPRRFASQVAGLVAPAGSITKSSAEGLLAESFAFVERPLPEEVHATELKRDLPFSKLIHGLLAGLEEREGWQPVRLENREDLGFGEIDGTYTRMVAELCVRTLERLTRGARDEEVWLTVKGARYMVNGEVQIGADAYESRIREHFAYATMRRGLATARWKLAGCKLLSGKRARELQICDLLSNASHKRYSTIDDAETRDRLRAAFGAFDFQLSFRELGRRVEGYVDEGSFGLALQALAEEMLTGGLSSNAEREAAKQLSEVIDALVALPAPVRDPHLSVLTIWIEQINEQLRDPGRGLAATDWALENVEGTLRKRLGCAAHTLDGFTLTLLRQKVTAANHRGALASAREAANALDHLIPRLAGRWEHGPRIIESLVAKSVHLIDTFEYEYAATQMHAVASYYGELSTLLGDALEGVFPSEVRSEQRGRALGTQLQAVMYVGLSDPSRLDEARRLNDEAIGEFEAPSDIQRQQQYRCQLETFAGDLAAARSYLAKSLGVEPTHAATAAHIANLPREEQGFPLMHWLRLGAAVLGGPDSDDAVAFASALKNTKVHTWSWSVDPSANFPAHAIRRYLATILARQKQSHEAQSMLGRLRELAPDTNAPLLLRVIVAAGHLEVAGALWPSDAPGARRLLEGSKTSEGARGLVDSLVRGTEPYPALATLAQRWQSSVKHVLEGELHPHEIRDLLSACARLVGY